jgi:hypothetical protein
MTLTVIARTIFFKLVRQSGFIARILSGLSGRAGLSTRS